MAVWIGKQKHIQGNTPVLKQVPLPHSSYILGRAWLICILLTLAACNPTMPPLPATSTAPPLEIAVLSPTSGEFLPAGRRLRHGIEMAFDAWNSRSDPTGPRLSWRLYDTDCTFATGQQAAQQAIADGHQFILGPICSEAAIAAAAEAETAGVVLIAPASPHPLVTMNPQGQPRPTVFRAVFTPDFQGQMAATFAIGEVSATKAAIFIVPGDDYGLALARAFADRFTNDGKLVYQTEVIADNTANLLAAQQAGAELIYLPAEPATANQVVGQLRDAGLNDNLSLVGDDRWDSSQLDRSLAEGSYFPRQFSLDGDNPAVAAWAESYKSIYAIEPDALAALGFDSATMLAQAIDQAGSTAPVAVAEAMARTQFSGVTGTISFNPEHNPRQSIRFVRIMEGQLQPLITHFPK
jgi:branched-chain amino acid transport system substrate-binding protein